MARRKSIRINRADRFIADTHLMHPLMVSTDRKDQWGNPLPQLRQFDSIREHDDHLVDMWNAVTAASDTIYHLGDFAWDRAPIEDVQKLFKRLKGKKVLLAGNHDHPDFLTLGWDAVHQGPVHLLDTATNTRVIGHHWPLREWDGWYSGAVHLHGHTHNSLPSSRRSIDVGVDAIGYLPMTIAELHVLRADLPELDFRGVEVEEMAPVVEEEVADCYGR